MCKTGISMPARDFPKTEMVVYSCGSKESSCMRRLKVYGTQYAKKTSSS